MKKLLSILAIATIFTVSTFAASNSTANIKLNGNVNSTAYALALAYGSDFATATNIGAEDFPINNTDGSKFNLTQNGSTQDFFVSISGNENTTPSISVTITPEDFLPYGNSADTVFKSTDKVPVAIVAGTNNTIAAGIHHNSLVKSFSLKWDGNSELTAGTYQSNVTVAYSVN